MPNASIEAIDFDRVRRGDAHETGNGLELVWEALNAEISARQRQVRLSINRSERAVLEIAPTASVDDYDIGDVSILLCTGASSVNLTGLLAPSAGAARVPRGPGMPDRATAAAPMALVSRQRPAGQSRR